jgi:predicted permease
MRRFLELLARAFPADFRGRFGAGMIEQIGLDYERERARGAWRALVFALSTSLDLIRSGVAERWSPTWKSNPEFRTRGDGAMEAMLTRDLRHALRSLARSPVFTAIALVTLGLGIGANTAIFSIVNGVLLRPLAYPQPEELMRLGAEYPDRALPGVSPPEYLEYREINQSFVALGAFSTGSGSYTTGEVNIAAGDRPLRVRSISVDAHLLRALGVQPAQGRLFSEGETALGMGGLATPVAILSYELSEGGFGGRPLIGQTVNIDGRAHEIIGIMPPGIDLMDKGTEVWLPLGLVSALRDNRTFHTFGVIGRLKDGVTAQTAQAELDGFLLDWSARTGASEHVPKHRPSLAGEHALRLEPLQDAIVGDASRSVWMLQAAAGFVLLIACANLANLLMARAETRRREFAVRAALGAGRARLLRQAITESVILAAAGGLLGLGLAQAGVQAFVRAYPTAIPRTRDVVIDVPVLFFALGVSLTVGVLFGLTPAVRGRIKDLVTALKEGGDRVASSAGRHHVRRALVVGEVALSVMLVIGAGLLIRTVYNLESVDAGFDRTPLVTFSVTFPEPYDPDTRALAYQRFLEKVRAAPGVQNAAFMSGLPPQRSPEAIRTVIENHTAADGSAVELIDYYQLVMGEYFKTMGIPIVAGRGFERADAGAPDRVVVVNETLASRVWPGQNPIGRRVRISYGAFGFGGNGWHTVVGVAKDVGQGGLDSETGSELFVAIEQIGLAAPTMNAVLRTSLAPAALSSTLQRLVQEVDPAVPVVRVRQMESVFAESIRRPRLLAHLLGAFAGLALLLAAVGTYGVLSYLVTERQREVGIRIALGARRTDVFALVMGQGLQLAMIGVGVGVAGALALNRLIASVLFGVQPTDLGTLGAVISTITLVAALACGLPAWRAARLNPNDILGKE